MRKSNPENLDRPKYADIQRDSMEDIKELQASPNSGEVRYRDPNRDRALGEVDRTGRHFDEVIDREAEADASENRDSENHEAD
jgi:hypothetical protein